MANSKLPRKHHPNSGRVRKKVRGKVPSVLDGPEASLSRLKDRKSFLSAASFRAPEKIVPSAWHEHAPFAFWLVEKLRPRVLVELGTHNGFSYFAFCQAIRMAGLSAAAFAVDRWTGDEHAGFYGEDIYEGVEAYNVERYSDISTLMKMAFADALQYFEDGSVDLLHIDGRHHFDDVKTDFESWLPKLSDRAVVLFHDTNAREREFGAHRFWSEVCRHYPNFNFIHGHGLGVLGVGKTCPSPVAALFTASADEILTASIRNAYARLGGAVTLAFRASEASQLWTAAAREAGALGTEREALRQHIAELSDDQSRLQAQAEATAAKLKDELDRTVTMLSAERQRAAEQTDQLAELEERHKFAEAGLAARADDAERALEEAARDKEALSQTLAASVAERDALREERGRLAAELLSLQQELAEQAAFAAELAARADQAERALDAAVRGKLSLAQKLAASIAERDALREERQQIAAELLSRQQELTEKAAAAAELAARADQAGRALEEAALLHSTVKYMHAGMWAKLLPTTFRRHQLARRLIRSGLFDTSWYMAEYPDVEQSGLDAADHYLEIGFCRGHKPNPFFDTRFYLERYEDIRISGMNPLLHYLLHGFREGRDPGPDFDTVFYLETNPDVRANAMNPLAHYLRYGRNEGRLPMRA